jgi:hydroxyethylthiazole kinase-like uncharacterized protein yjeF
MLREAEGPEGLAAVLSDARKNVVALGPGLGVGETTRRLVETALSAAPEPAARRSVVLDADALTSFAGDLETLRTLIGKAPGSVVLTPHAGEFGRLFGDIDRASSKFERARRAAGESGAIVLLKGADTVVASPDGRASLLASAPPWLATAGSGDTLTGMIAGLLAQGMEPFAAASCAAWMHGRAATLFGPGLIADDIAATLPAVWRELVG